MEKIIEFMKIDTNFKIIITIVTLLFGYIIRGILIRIFHKKIQDTKVYYNIKKTINYIFFLLTLLIIMVLWGAIGSIGTYFGLVSAGLAIALKDLFINIAAWLFILFRKPFIVGDRIEIDGVAGDVIDLRVFQFTIMEIGNWVSNDQSTGRIIHIPNSVVLSRPLANFTGGFEYIWSEINVLLTFESDYKKAKPIFLKIAEKYSLHLTEEIEREMKIASKKYMIYYNKLTPIVYTDVKENGVMLSIRYLCIPHQRRNTIESIWEDVLKVIADSDDINLAYSTMRIVR